MSVPPGGPPRDRALSALLPPLLLTLLAALLTAFSPPLIEESLEGLLLDLRFRARQYLAPPPVPPEVVVVAVDEESLSARGRWPWPRSLQAELIGRICAGAPRVLAVDIFFPEPESPAADAALAGALAACGGRAVLALAFEVERGESFEGEEIADLLYDHALPRIENLSALWAPEARRALLAPPPIDSAAALGHVYTLPDRDGRLRWEPLVLKYGGEYFPSLSLQAARIALGLPLEEVTVQGGLGVDLGGRRLPTDAHGRLLVNYLGPAGSFPYLSAASLLDGKIPPERLRDAVVLLGTSAIATYDRIYTPLSANMPGVEKNATVVANVLAGELLRPLPLFADVLAVLALGLGLTLLLGRLGALASTAVVVTSLLAVLAGNFALFALWSLRANLLYPLGVVALTGAYSLAHRYYAEESRARGIRRLFSSYVTERVVNELIANPAMARLGGGRKEVTILFSDIRGFTTFSERNAPEEVVELLNEYLAAMADVVFRWEGTLDKFIGDAIVAFWGAPLPQEDHAERAVRCALDMERRLGELNGRWRAEGREPLEVGIGVNSGEVIVGNIGAEGRKMDYTVIGDHVNLAARVESLTKRYGAPILLTEFTLAQVRPLVERGGLGHVDVRGLERVAVKGKAAEVGIYRLDSLAEGSASVLAEGEGKVVRLEEK